MKYRHLPTVIDATQFFKEGDHPSVEFSGRDDTGKPYWSIKTLEGRMKVEPGSWIVTGVAGEVYAVRDDIFRETYEPVIG